MCTMCVSVPMEFTKVKGGGEPACVREKLNWGPLKEPQVLVTNELSLQPHAVNFLMHITSAPVGHLKFAPQVPISILLFPHLYRVEREARHRDSHTVLISTLGVLSINKKLEIQQQRLHKHLVYGENRKNMVYFIPFM